MFPSAFVLIPLILPACADAPRLEQAKIDAVDSIVSAYMSRNEIPGLTVAIALDGRVTWSKGYGMADVVLAVTECAFTVFPRLAPVDR